MNRFLFCTAFLGTAFLSTLTLSGVTSAAEPQNDAKAAESQDDVDSQDDVVESQDAGERAKPQDDAVESRDDAAESQDTADSQDTTDSQDTAESPPTKPKATTDKAAILLTGEDTDLTSAIAAELRAAGFKVTVVSPGERLDLRSKPLPTVVEVHQDGDHVIVQLDEIVEVPPGADDGMAGTDAAALRAAETIRLLVAAKNNHRAPRDKPAQDKAPKTDRGETSLPSVVVTVRPEIDGDIEIPPTAEVPKIRLGVYAGGGALVFPDHRYGDSYPGRFGPDIDAVRSAWAVGVSLGGNLSRTVNLSGRFTYAMDATDDESTNLWSFRSTVLASWEPLGADNVWTPVLGGGVFGEVMGVNNTEIYYHHECNFETGYGCHPEYFDEWYDEDVLFNSGLAANIGISVGRPWRFRFDVQGNVSLLSLGADEPFQILPSVIGTLGLEYDLITTQPAPKVAKR